ncbi:MAG: HDOD domain-containing protein [Steroidobacteraceae bacterium]|nr:HDOD domain-containing protein [Deltaproteobacteria bacterium]
MPKAILDSIEATCLPSMPQVLLRFLRLSFDENTSMAELATLVGQDPALSARILTVANSPALCRGAKTGNLLQCLVNLGIRLARTLAACLVVQKAFSAAEDSHNYDLTGFWGHSLRVAEVARAISNEVGYHDPEEVYLSGLLHDIGQLLLLGSVGESYVPMLVLCRDEYDLRDVEKQRLGTDHAAVGAWLVDQWKLSSFMSDSILFHHAPAEEIVAADALSRIVWAAHVICYRHRQPDPDLDERLPDLAAVSLMTGIDLSRISAIYTHCSERVVSVAAALGITENADAKTLPHTSTIPLVNLSPKHYYTIADTLIEEAVRDMALMQPLQQDLASLGSEAEILLAVRESARILFGVGQLVFLLVNPEKSALSGANVSCQPELLQRLEIPLDSKHSLAATVALENRPRSTFEPEHPASISLVDVQISRVLGCEGLLYVPLHGRRRNIGVMAYGVSAAQALRLRQRLKWITSFASMAAISIENWRDMRDRELNLESTLTRQFEQHARKVIHEAGNPLSIIKNYLAVVNQKLPDDNAMIQELEILGEEIDRVSLIMRRMSNLAEALPEAGALDVNNVIENMLVLYGDSLFSSRDITIEKKLDHGLAFVNFERDSFKQILLNLWNNAAEAMSNGGSLVIATQADINQNGRTYIEVRVSDTGPGLPPDVMHSLFQPLDPNRRPGHSGVGLSVVAALVERLDGRITCQSKAGLGTSFSILLPQTRKEAA